VRFDGGAGRVAEFFFIGRVAVCVEVGEGGDSGPPLIFLLLAIVFLLLVFSLSLFFNMAMFLM